MAQNHRAALWRAACRSLPDLFAEFSYDLRTVHRTGAADFWIEANSAEFARRAAQHRRDTLLHVVAAADGMAAGRRGGRRCGDGVVYLRGGGSAAGRIRVTVPTSLSAARQTSRS